MCDHDCFKEVFLGIFLDLGARERAAPHLRKFAVADPKLPLYQARLKRSSSAPNQKRRSNTDQLPRKAYAYTCSQMAKKGTSTDDVRTVGRLSMLGFEEGADGKFKFKSEHMVLSDIQLLPATPADRALRPTQSHQPSQPNHIQRNSFPETTVQSTRTKECPNCREPITTQRPVWETHHDLVKPVKCSKCGQTLQSSVSGRSLPGLPYSKHEVQTYSSSDGKPPWQNADEASSAVAQERHSAASTQSDQSAGTFNRTDKASSAVAQERHSAASTQSDQSAGTFNRTLFSNGDVITLQVPKASASSVSADLSNGKCREFQYENAPSLALKLFKLEGFKREEVAKELYKK